MARFLANRLLGVDLTATATDAAVPVGTRVWDEDGNEYVYVLAGTGGVAAGVTQKFASGFVSTASGNAGAIDGIGFTAISAASYGFVQVRGIYTAANVATGISTDDFLAPIADANGDFQATVAPSSASAVVGIAAVRAKALSNESSGLASVLLY